MEKFAKRAKKIAKFGLLVFVLILFSQKNFAQISRRAKTVSSENFLFVTDEKKFFVNQDATLKLFIPQVKSSNVQIILPNFPENVVFVSSRIENSSSWIFGYGTQIELNLNFKDGGIFSLPPISLFINGRKEIVNFPDVEVLQNPEAVLPRAILVFDEDNDNVWNNAFFSSDESFYPNHPLKKGIALRFTVYVQYAKALGQISWSLPKDAIFKELQRFEIPSDLKFSKRIPVAQFEWTPLSEGNVSLPKIQIAVESYSGEKIFIETPDRAVKIISQKQSAKENVQENSFANAEKIFEHAFDFEDGEHDADFENAAPEYDALLKIAQLRSQERHSFFQNKIRSERAAAEKSFGIGNAPTEESFPFFVLLFSAAIFFAASSLILFLLRKKNFAFVSAALAISFSIFAFAHSSKIFERHGIVLGGEIYPVPENSAVSKTAAIVASRVLIRQEIDSWYFIEYNEGGGWIKKENLILIK